MKLSRTLVFCTYVAVVVGIFPQFLGFFLDISPNVLRSFRFLFYLGSAVEILYISRCPHCGKLFGISTRKFFKSPTAECVHCGELIEYSR